MLIISFEQIWENIIRYSGQKIFKTKRGEPFSYSINNNIVITNRTDQGIRKRNFLIAYDMWPLDGPGKINNIIRGSSYVWAILNDDRISQSK